MLLISATVSRNGCYWWESEPACGLADMWFPRQQRAKTDLCNLTVTTEKENKFPSRALRSVFRHAQFQLPVRGFWELFELTFIFFIFFLIHYNPSFRFLSNLFNGQPGQQSPQFCKFYYYYYYYYHHYYRNFKIENEEKLNQKNKLIFLY